ncbi:Peptidyl-prolyl cis-trans isomerase fkbp14 [Desmophyllum pertusum]|uniref:peptidylprolyl isomerase n=1 Tax=Desmophyllum pertusum TaxID=174260 RepID=A0A9X0CME6_9CNID|nr:Peptidyl-prolyl cis-trans isomerase fkbp14 [Desmophyllum pertusum]
MKMKRKRRTKPMIKDQHEDQKSKKKSEEQDDHEEEDDEEEDEEDEHEDEEEVDPNAKIDVHDLFTPKDCVNKSKSGDLVVIHYTGWMDDGTLFDTTIDATKGYMPFEFMLGTGTVIKGFERGVLDMCRGQKREIVIPPSLGYGKRGAGEIPGNSTLTYELEMFDIRKPPPQADMFSLIDSNGDKKLSKKEISEYMKAQAEAHGMPTYDKKWRKHHKTVVANIFDHEDTDEDGAISHDEFSGPR